MTDIIEELKRRGLIEQQTDEQGLKALLAEKTGVPLYIGFDPTATSLHVGSLLPIVVMAHFQKNGHKPIVVLGGATGMIGDPSFKSNERVLLTEQRIEENLKGIQAQFSRFIEFGASENAAIMVNNYDWTSPISYIEWLRDVGKMFSVNVMISKESVRRRLEERDQGISYTEFSYMMLQAYDFLHLYRTYGCAIQGGGKDQWGNITAGIELVRKSEGATVYGLTFPLVTTASGEKFGKSEGNAVWLDADKTSPYQFYQFWIQTEDSQVAQYLKFFTFLPLEKIDEIMAEHEESPHLRQAQKTLAEEVTRWVHGEDALQKALTASQVLFGQAITGLSDQDLGHIFADVPSTELATSQLGDINLLQLLRETGVAQSNGDAKRAVQSGGVYLNNEKVSDPQMLIDASSLASESTLIIRKGKKNYHLVRFIEA